VPPRYAICRSGILGVPVQVVMLEPVDRPVPRLSASKDAVAK
jgi:hypothetical protein